MRIWVARAEGAARRTAERLVALGHEPLVAPVLRILCLPTARPSCPCDGIVLTSANAVPALAQARLDPAPIFAVGQRTAAIARAAGLEAVVASEGDAVTLAALIRDTLSPGSALLLVAGQDRKPEPEASLRTAGFQMSVWVAYEACPVPELPPTVASALTEHGLDAALHYSRRSTHVALELARSAGLERPLRNLRHYCLSRDVAVPLVEAGIPAHFVAARPDEDSLLAGFASKR